MLMGVRQEGWYGGGPEQDGESDVAYRLEELLPEQEEAGGE